MKLDEITFQGYKRKNGKPGIRNRVLVVYTVKCAEFVARQIVDRSDDPDVELVGFDGCTDNQYAVNLLISLIRHPNVGAVLSVGLGCEYIQPEWLADIATKEGKLSQWMFIQKEGGTRSAMEKGLAFVQWALKKLKETPRVPMKLSDLVIGAECGGSDYTSGLAGNALVGRFFDKLTDLAGQPSLKKSWKRSVFEICWLKEVQIRRRKRKSATPMIKPWTTVVLYGSTP